MSNPNRTCVIQGDIGARRRERPALADGILPGFLVEPVISNNLEKCKPHSTYGDAKKPWFALEDTLQGRTVDDEYEADDPVFMWKPQPGDVIMLRLAAGQIVTQYDNLISLGDGTVGKGHTLQFSQTTSPANVTNASGNTSFAQNMTIPANTLRAGDKIVISGWGNTPTTNSTDTFQFVVKVGTATVVASAAVDVANNAIFQFNCTVNFTDVGATGHFVAQGSTLVANSPTGNAPTTFQTPSTVANTAGPLTVDIFSNWSAASTSDIASLRQSNIELDQTNGGEAVYAQADASLDLSAEADNDFIRSIKA